MDIKQELRDYIDHNTHKTEHGECITLPALMCQRALDEIERLQGVILDVITEEAEKLGLYE